MIRYKMAITTIIYSINKQISNIIQIQLLIRAYSHILGASIIYHRWQFMFLNEDPHINKPSAITSCLKRSLMSYIQEHCYMFIPISPTTKISRLMWLRVILKNVAVKSRKKACSDSSHREPGQTWLSLLPSELWDWQETTIPIPESLLRATQSNNYCPLMHAEI